MAGHKKITDKLRQFIADTRGQAAVEYAILASLTVMLTLVALQQLWVGVLDFYQDVACLICLPIP